MKKHKNNPATGTPVFVLRMRYCEGEAVKDVEGKIIYPIPLKTETLGYFTDIKKAEYYISFPQKDVYWFLEDHPFKIFELEEHGLNYFLMQGKTRVYDRSGSSYGEYDIENIEKFQGRDETECKFKVCDRVEYIDDDKLKFGKVVGMPPDKKWMKKLHERPEKSSRTLLDSRDDTYLINDVQPVAKRLRIKVPYVFEPSVKI